MPSGRAGGRLGEPARRRAQRVAVRPLEITDDASIRDGARVAAGGGGPSGRRRLGRQARRDPGAAWEVNAAGTARLTAAAEAAPRGRRAGSTDPAGLDRRGVRRRPAGAAGGDRPAAAALALRGQQGGRGGGGARGGAPDRPPGRGRPAVSAHRRRPEPGLRRAGLRRAAPGGAGRRGPRPCRPGTWPRCATCSTCGTWSRAYRLLLEHGAPGEAYNVARGDGLSLAEVFARLAALIGTPAVPAADPSLVRSADIPHLVGDSTKLRRATGWAPAISLDRTLQELVDAQAD